MSWNDHGVRSWYGCLRHHRPVELDVADQATQALHSARIASPYASYANFSGSGLGNSTTVTLVDLRNERLQATQAGADVSDVTLLRWGGVVYRSGSEGYTPALRLLTFSGERRIAVGAIQRGSVAVNRKGTRVYWTEDGQALSAPLR